MRKRLIAAAIALAIAFTLGCGKDGGDVKLLESITDDKGKVLTKYEYDNQNRLVKIYEYSDGKIDRTKKITYDADGSVTIEKVYSGDCNNCHDCCGIAKYAKNEIDKINKDKDGYIVSEGTYGDGPSIEYKYKDGNLIHIDWNESAYTDDFSYDDKKSPFSNTTTPKWLLDRIGLSASKNNVVRYEGEHGSTTKKYEYDSDGFPTKVNEEGCGEEGCSKYTTLYTYRGATK